MQSELSRVQIAGAPGWEGCGRGAHGTQHYANGTPAVRPDFPDLKALVDYGSSHALPMLPLSTHVSSDSCFAVSNVLCSRVPQN